MRRVEEEMRKRERLEAERKEREKQLSEQQAEEERKAIEECERYVGNYVCQFFNTNQVFSDVISYHTIHTIFCSIRASGKNISLLIYNLWRLSNSLDLLFWKIFRHF